MVKIPWYGKNTMVNYGKNTMVWQQNHGTKMVN